MLGWVLTGKTLLQNLETEKEFFVCSSCDEFNQMCSQEVLGLTDSDNNWEPFHENFQAKLQRLEDGTHSNRLPWRPDHPLTSNKKLTMARLRSTTQKLEKLGKIEEYHKEMEQQLEQGILELAPIPATGQVI